MRPRLPARLYLAKTKDRAANWVIRDGYQVIRTGAREHETDKARDAFQIHAIATGQLAGISSEINYTRANPAKPATIYFLTCDQPGFPIKIGIASNLNRRLRGLQNALPFEVLLLGTMPGSLLDEQAVHSKFQHLKLRGEWFTPAPDLAEFIQSLNSCLSG